MGAEQSVMQYDNLFYDHPNESETWYGKASKAATDKKKDDEEGRRRKWRLKLPVNGQIALRRCLRRGSDPFIEERKQISRWEHDYMERYGALRNVEVVFKEVLWSAENQSWSRMAKKFDGAHLSPRSVPTVEQMSFTEYVNMVGPEAMGLVRIEDEEYELEGEAEDPLGDLLECNYYARRGSDVFAEDWFEVNPYEGVPKSA